MKVRPMFLRCALILIAAASIACGAKPERSQIRFEPTADIVRLGALQYVAFDTSADERSMALWVRVGAFDAATDHSAPEVATALAWSYESDGLQAAVYPFATKFSWTCAAAESLGDCAQRGLVVLRAPPGAIDLDKLQQRLDVGRRARASGNPDAAHATHELLESVFADAERLAPLGSEGTALHKESFLALWESRYGANNALLVGHGFDSGEEEALREQALSLRTASADFAVPVLSLQAGEVARGESAPGYTWTAALSPCFGVLKSLEAAAIRLQPSLQAHLIDVRGRGFLLALVGPPPDAETTALVQTVASAVQCGIEDPVMRWLVGGNQQNLGRHSSP